ncbi:ArsR/SmtB family transcription factor [Paracidobacterium acidisoli]|uniref:ArsR family transcriptional regulator n=1 Tax=Paracidobacterium acidisoli TaxID=2303751 RepID=A0A372IN33_9BACT|nr:metalloregulator ArsR/SmtB family transcription factor [Paracidobacterium acidisoli]MBT9331795.1 metalloregulator ArsR/SmtB family transcription factor [Paracidobacterium acidisoli]
MLPAAEIFRTLADPTRVAIYDCIARQEMTVSEIKGRFPVSQPAISQHLAILRRAGLASERRAGRHVHYRADPAGLKPMIRWLEYHQAFWHERMPRLKAVLKEMKDE